ncbi:MAG: heavy-metal-associated domain-containing protein [Methanobrevibacter wolinii]|nr:heavy-metal-associated domain-containing protein [Methanobrevibacter wolinii]
MANEKKEFKVVGMHCPSCVNAVELSLTDVDGIDSAKASLEDNNVIIDYDASKVSDKDIEDAVEEAGFKVE